MKTLIIRWIEGEEVGREIIENTTAQAEMLRVKELTEQAGNFTESGYDFDKDAFWLIKNCSDNCMWFYNHEVTVQEEILEVVKKMESSNHEDLYDAVPELTNKLKEVVGRINSAGA